MTDRLKIVRIHARNVPRTRTQALRRRRVSRLQESDGVTCSMRRGAVLLKHKKLVLGQPAHNLPVTSISKNVVATVCPLHFDTRS